MCNVPFNLFIFILHYSLRCSAASRVSLLLDYQRAFLSASQAFARSHIVLIAAAVCPACLHVAAKQNDAFPIPMLYVTTRLLRLPTSKEIIE